MLKVEAVDQYTSDKIVAFKGAIKLIERLKKSGKTVGLCHGGFDLLHPGHVKHFESAKKLCDVLFVSVTSDRFVSCRKGSGRPIFTDRLRAYLAASVRFVDYAVITDFQKAMEILKQLKPTYYIKGPDFINKNTPGIIAEREAIKDVEGEMKYTNDPPSSTTKIIEYIKKDLDVKNVLLLIDRDGTVIKNDDFPGKNDNWRNELEFNEDVISFISYLQTKYDTIKIIISNQTGVARRFFDCKRVEDVNDFVISHLSKKGIRIDNVQYCPDADKKWADKHPGLGLDRRYIKDKTKRKPGNVMVLDALKELKKELNDFTEIIVIGNGEDDKGLAESLNALFIDINGKDYKALLKEFP